MDIGILITLSFLVVWVVEAVSDLRSRIIDPSYIYKPPRSLLDPLLFLLLLLLLR